MRLESFIIYLINHEIRSGCEVTPLLRYEGITLLLSAFKKMRSINARIFSGSSSILFASWMSSSVTFTIFSIYIYNDE